MASKGPIPNFLDKVSSNWGLSFIFTKIWAVHFSPIDSSRTLGEAIYTVLKAYDDINKFTDYVNSDSNLYKNLLKSENNITVDLPDAKHFILANKISIPNESVFIGSTNTPNQETAGGAIWGRFAGSRENNAGRTVDITFLDTNKELVDLIIKPWIIAVAHRGLIESSFLPTLKCHIIAYFYAKSSPNAKTTPNGDKITITSNYPQYYKTQSLNTEPFVWASQGKEVLVSSFNENQPYLRKRIIFRNCVPVSVPQKNYNYAPDMGNDETMTEIKFSYDWYEIDDFSNGFLSTDLGDLPSIVWDSPEGNRTTITTDPITGESNLNTSEIGQGIV